MVQMKALLIVFSFFFFGLYIPHGSDERKMEIVLKLIYDFFISHMVQMKGYFYLSTLFLAIPLYPTWFR